MYVGDGISSRELEREIIFTEHHLCSYINISFYSHEYSLG